MMRKAAEKHKDRKCMGVRTIEECLVEGKKQFWRKGDYAWRTYGDVFADVDRSLAVSPTPRVCARACVRVSACVERRLRVLIVPRHL